MDAIKLILKYFNSRLGKTGWKPEPNLYSSLFMLPKHKNIDSTKFNNVFNFSVCEKLDLYNESIKFFIDTAAKHRVFFNFIQKQSIKRAFCLHDKKAISKILDYSQLSSEIKKNIINHVEFLSSHEIDEILSIHLQKDEKSDYILNSLFSAFTYRLVFTDRNSSSDDYFRLLKSKFPTKYDRSYALSFSVIDNMLISRHNDYKTFLAYWFSHIAEQYEKLQNHCYFVVLIEPLSKGISNLQWKLYSDTVLFAEKHIEENLKIGYFHPEKIEQTTSDYISGLNHDKADFKIANTGFTYKDCYILTNSDITPGDNFDNYSILLLFQKNCRDEDAIPCPACLSENVRGNSYPSIGIKSWECNNPLCPEHSLYNRGKRFSLISLLKQEAIENPENEIPYSTIADWRLDLVQSKSHLEALEAIILEYSFIKDCIHCFNFKNAENKIRNRNIIYHEELSRNSDYKPCDLTVDSFFDGAFFHRFKIIRIKNENNIVPKSKKFNHVLLINGDCESYLRAKHKDFFYSAITSPPYYNAKEYSHWDNIYCYLYDMYNHARQVFRTLKPGGYYVFNIFDYFDNENNIVFSAMGKKRMILGAYIIHLFNEIGFELQGNTIWYKGHVQGHRSSNQGNNVPYYQAPINCYEHVFCFRKPGKEVPFIEFPTIIHATPVIKIIKGENRIGHSAPFPIEIPNLLIERINNGPILDPYGGSFTTAKCASIYGLDSYSCELSPYYYKLGTDFFSSQSRGLAF